MIPIPDFLKEEIRRYILSQCPQATTGWPYANHDEDTLTGDFLGRLRSDWTKSDTHIWRLFYNKPSSRSAGSMESKIGADGIITMHVRDPKANTNYYKSLVFQAKKQGNAIDNKQWDKMKDFFPGGNIILNYTPNSYDAIMPSGNTMGICTLIAFNFLNCSIGIEGLYYNHLTNKFVRPDSTPLTGKVSHELMIEVFESR
jgi:hypothetical protein